MSDCTCPVAHARTLLPYAFATAAKFPLIAPSSVGGQRRMDSKRLKTTAWPCARPRWWRCSSTSAICTSLRHCRTAASVPDLHRLRHAAVCQPQYLRCSYMRSCCRCSLHLRRCPLANASHCTRPYSRTRCRHRMRQAYLMVSSPT